MSPCRLETQRLLLRPPESADIDGMLPLIGEYEVAKNLSSVPHPYGPADAEYYLAKTADTHTNGEGFGFAIVRNADGKFMGCCGLHSRQDIFELGYWLGKPFWGRGFATEAAHELARFAFDSLGVARLVAGWFRDNPASGRILDKLGCKPVGSEERDCRARGHAVYCHMMTLDREDFKLRNAMR